MLDKMTYEEHVNWKEIAKVTCQTHVQNLKGLISRSDIYGHYSPHFQVRM